MKILMSLLVVLGALIVIILISKYWFASRGHKAQIFSNTEKVYQAGISSLWPIAKAYGSTKRQAPIPQGVIPLEVLTPEILAQSTEDTVYRLGPIQRY